MKGMNAPSGAVLSMAVLFRIRTGAGIFYRKQAPSSPIFYLGTKMYDMTSGFQGFHAEVVREIRSITIYCRKRIFTRPNCGTCCGKRVLQKCPSITKRHRRAYQKKRSPTLLMYCFITSNKGCFFKARVIQ
jgi:hypothetical protein